MAAYCALEVTFSKLALIEKKRLVSKGMKTRNQSALSNLVVNKEDKVVRKFSLNYYDRYAWMAGCDCEEDRHRCFCFPRALFSQKTLSLEQNWLF